MNPNKIFLKLLILVLLIAASMSQDVDGNDNDNDDVDVDDVVSFGNDDVVDEDNEVGVDASVSGVVTDGDKSYDNLLDASEEYQPIDPMDATATATSADPASTTEGKLLLDVRVGCVAQRYYSQA